MTYDSIDALLARMGDDLTTLQTRGDARRHFHATYLRTTRAVADEIARGGFADEDWVRRWDLAFAGLYLDALEADQRGTAVAGPWRVAFDAARRQPDLPPLRHVLFGLNAHINYDLPQALLAVISSADFDNPEALRRREADHRHLDSVLQARVGAEDDELGAVSTVTRLDRFLRPANRAATRRLLAEARAKVWRNAVTLDRARRAGAPEYASVLGELERRCAARVLDLTAPGPVLLTLARRGFGVLIPGS
jgi:hypothetical protein